MTPKEEAKELVESFTDIENEYREYSDTIPATQCALICVDEIMLLFEQNEYDSRFGYYLEVKKEIEKLK